MLAPRRADLAPPEQRVEPRPWAASADGDSEPRRYPPRMDPGAARIIEAIWRQEFAALVASLVRKVGDLGLAEELAQDAFVAALERWPAEGTPMNPGAWLTTVAHRRAVDRLRRTEVERREAPSAADGRDPIEDLAAVDVDPAALADREVRDDVLRLMFLCCHPRLPQRSRAILTLKLCTGLSTAEIARAYLSPEATIAQRIVRAKRTLAEHAIAFDLPVGGELRERLSAVLEALYLLFNEGYAGTAGEEWVRADLCEEALRLGRVLAGRMSGEPEVQGLVALMELQASRLAARRDAGGAAVLLFDQDRALWNRVSIRRGLAALERSRELSTERAGAPGAYALQAEIAACHARASRPEATDWSRIVALYRELARIAPSPVVELNRAVAVAMAYGAEAGLLLLQRLEHAPGLEGYHLLPSVRGELLRRVGRLEEAIRDFEMAASMTANARERALLLRRAEQCRRA
jgi:RNA polymerase sigma factor (sigma-70 family)